MASPKEEIRRMLDGLPANATWEDVQYSIYVRERIDRGRRGAEQGAVIDELDVEARMKAWLDECQPGLKSNPPLDSSPATNRIMPPL